MNHLKIFVYGSLKVGQRNCQQFCSGHLSVEPAYIKGTMFEFPTSGFPVITIPEENILAVGTKNPWEDVRIQRQFSEAILRDNIDFSCKAEDVEYSTIHGDLFTFADPEIRLPEMDWFEGYRPGRRSYYKRVLAYICKNNSEYETAWVYVQGENAEGLVEIPSGIWNTRPNL